MKRQSLVLLAVAFVAAGAAGCFKDPVSGLRGGPAVLDVNESAVILKTGDSIAVLAYLKDNAGNVMPETDAIWTSADPTVAAVRKDSSQAIPGNAYTRAFIVGVNALSGGVTTVTVTTRNVSDTIRVVVIPAKFQASLVATAGAAALTDTIVNPASALTSTPRTYTAYSAKDTLVLNGTSTLTFDTSKVTVQIGTPTGASKGLIVSKSPSQLKVVFEVGAAGKVMIQHLLLTPGNAAVGTIKVDTLIADSVAVAAWHPTGATFGGSIALAGDTLTVNAANGMTFDGKTTVDLTDATDTLGTATPTYIITQTPTQMTVLSSATVAKQRVTLRKVHMAAAASVGSVLFDSLKTNNAPWAMNQASLPASYVVKSGDTLFITAVAPVVFGATGPGDTLANGTLQKTGVTFDTGTAPNIAPAANAIILAQTGTTLSYVLSPVANNGPISVTNALVGQTRIPTLTTAGAYNVNAFALPAANVSLGGGKLGDTVTVTAPAGMPFSTSGAVSKVLLGNRAIATSDTAWVLSRTASTIKAFAKRGGNGAVTVTNLNLGAIVVPTLSTLAKMQIDSTTSDLPVTQSQGSALALTIPANDTAIVYGTALPGALNGGFAQSYWTFTTSATHTIFGNVAWFGSGNPYGSGANTTANTEDLDMLICDASTVCDESDNDLSGFAAATTAQPQKFTVAGLPAAQYWINVAGFNVKYTIIYQLTVVLK